MANAKKKSAAVSSAGHAPSRKKSAPQSAASRGKKLLKASGSSKKPKKIPVSNSDPRTVELSDRLDRLTPSQENFPAASDKSIAQRTARLKTDGPFPVLRWVILIPLAALAFFFFCCVAGYRFSGLICLSLMGVILFYNITALLRHRWPRSMKILRRILTVILCLGLSICAATEGLIIRASLGNPDPNISYLLVLGAKVRSDGPSLSLQNRIDAAFNYLTAHPEVTAVVTGGQGPDEPVTEAACMFRQLTRRGIPAERIVVEDKATSTWENLHYSLDLIEEISGRRPEKVGVLSSEYHLFRASLFARECGVEFVGVPAKTTKLPLKINYFLREVAGVWHYILLGGQYK